VRRAFKTFFDDVRAHGNVIYDLRLAINEFNIGLQYSRARPECHAIANLTASGIQVFCEFQSESRWNSNERCAIV
jgi:hypothetical protein